MFFSEFKKNIPRFQQIAPGGQDVQFLMAPEHRIRFDVRQIKTQPTPASVLILFFPTKNNETAFVLTKRANYDGHHAGQISFPGGKRDKKDTGAKTTALRELQEEIGISIKNENIFVKLTELFVFPSHFLVQPYLAFTNTTPSFKVNYEVESVITPLLSDLLDRNNIQTTQVQVSKKEIQVPCFVFNNEIIWGATAMILSELRDLFNKVL